MLVGFRWVCPIPAQAWLLAWTVGCPRVVFNDALRVGLDPDPAGEKDSNAQVLALVLTLTKTTLQWQRLSEVAAHARKEVNHRVIMRQRCRANRCHGVPAPVGGRVLGRHWVLPNTAPHDVSAIQHFRTLASFLSLGASWIV